MVALRTELSVNDLATVGFGFGVHEKVNELVYETLVDCIEPGSQADMFFMPTDSSTERNGRRAMVDPTLAKGCVSTGIREYCRIRMRTRAAEVSRPRASTLGLSWRRSPTL
ncbi:hypothetical protein CYMTET_13226 [Cymbomonas tetramitiformis]|uniref:Uncharacterized protein n=1 Tax=Cymbomonas tetramitiformis TaxID=36881 RepID=A0AAE0GIY5_9CHLO|nr:hypothetical protein CYMTET_13226 [Cymbomonas tetramitiformis]